MKKFYQFYGHVRVLHGVFIVALLVVSAVQSRAQIDNLSARNTALQIDVAGGTPGLSDWTVNGINQLDQQWFYYSVGGGSISSIDNIGTFSSSLINAGFSPSLTEVYSNSTFLLTTTYILGSGQVGSGTASLSTTVTLQNLSGATQNIDLYQYSDFWLGGVSGGQNVQFTTTNSPYNVFQSGTGGPLNGKISSVSGGTGDVVEEVAGLFNGTQFGIVNGGPTVTLNDSPLSAGTGNVNYAYEIESSLTASGAGSSVTISELQTVPEPSSLALISSGILFLALYCGHKTGFFCQWQKRFALARNRRKILNNQK
jgi:hypothetical protein